MLAVLGFWVMVLGISALPLNCAHESAAGSASNDCVLSKHGVQRIKMWCAAIQLLVVLTALGFRADSRWDKDWLPRPWPNVGGQYLGPTPVKAIVKQRQ